MAGHVQSARSWTPTKLYKCAPIKHLRTEVDQAKEGSWRADARFLKSDLALAGCAECNGRQCKMHDFTDGVFAPGS